MEMWARVGAARRAAVSRRWRVVCIVSNAVGGFEIDVEMQLMVVVRDVYCYGRTFEKGY